MVTASGYPAVFRKCHGASMDWLPTWLVHTRPCVAQERTDETLYSGNYNISKQLPYGQGPQLARSTLVCQFSLKVPFTSSFPAQGKRGVLFSLPGVCFTPAAVCPSPIGEVGAAGGGRV